MDAAKCNAGGVPVMDMNPIQKGIEILKILLATDVGTRETCWPDWLLGSQDRCRLFFLVKISSLFTQQGLKYSRKFEIFFCF